MFDVMLRELATRFGLGDKARDLLAALLALIFDPGNGGFEGFVARLRAAGLGAVVDSWVGRGENKLINSAGVQSAFGPELLDRLAAKAGMNRERTASALTALLPGVLDKLTPDAVRPAAGQVPPEVSSYLAGAEGFAAQARAFWPKQQLEKTVEVALPASPVPTSTTPAAVHGHGDRDADQGHGAGHGHGADLGHGADHGPSRDGGMGGRWIAWAALLLIALGVAAWLRHPSGEIALPPPLPNDGGEPAVAPVTGVRASAPTLRLAYLNGGFQIDGSVGQAGERQRVLDAATQAAGKPPLGTIAVDGQLEAAGWLTPLVNVLPELAVEGLAMELSGSVVDLLSVPPGSDPAGLAKLGEKFPGQQLTGWFDPAARALHALPGEIVDMNALAAALNLLDLHFTSGGHMLRSDSRRMLRRAAAALKRAPQDSLIRVGGHTSERGTAQDNLDLSEARAYAVVEALHEDGVPHDRLQAQGFGAAAPVLGNDPARRIVFTVLRPAPKEPQP